MHADVLGSCTFFLQSKTKRVAVLLAVFSCAERHAHCVHCTEQDVEGYEVFSGHLLFCYKGHAHPLLLSLKLAEFGSTSLLTSKTIPGSGALKCNLGWGVTK